MARIDLSTAGVTINYAAESVAGTMPTTGYTKIPGAKAIPEIGSTPETIESTTLDEVDFKTYIQGLIDTGGNLDLTFNLTEEFLTTWETLRTAYSTAKAAGKQIYFAIIVPKLTKNFVFVGSPSPLGFGGADVGNVLEATGSITLNKIEGWVDKVTVS